MRIKIILKEDINKSSTIISRLQKLDNWNMSRNTVRFVELFDELFTPNEYKLIPLAIKRWGNLTMAGQILFYVNKKLGKKLCIALYKIASENSSMKELLDKRGFDKAIYDDKWYESNNLLESKYDEERLKMLADSGDEEAKKELEKLNSRKDQIDLKSVIKKMNYYIDQEHPSFEHILIFFKDILSSFPEIIDNLGKGSQHSSWVAMRMLKAAKVFKIMASNENKKPLITFDPETEKKLLNIVHRNYRYDY